MRTLKIDPEFQALCPALGLEELPQLRRNLEAEGCRDPLVTWNGILIDGHHRYALCQELGEEFKVVEADTEALPDREHVINWIIQNQLGRRNLPPAQASYLRGKQYELEKTLPWGNRKSRYQSDTEKRTREIVATTHSVSQATISRDAKFAKAVDKIGKVSPSLKAKALSGELPKEKVIEIANSPKAMQEAAKPEATVGDYLKVLAQDKQWVAGQGLLHVFKAMEKLADHAIDNDVDVGEMCAEFRRVYGDGENYFPALAETGLCKHLADIVSHFEALERRKDMVLNNLSGGAK